MLDIIGVGDTNVDVMIRVPRIASHDEKVRGQLLGNFPGGIIGNFCCAAAAFPAALRRCAASSPRHVPHDSAFVIPSRSSSLRRLSFPRYTMLVICFTVFPVTSAACA